MQYYSMPELPFTQQEKTSQSKMVLRLQEEALESGLAAKTVR